MEFQSELESQSQLESKNQVAQEITQQQQQQQQQQQTQEPQEQQPQEVQINQIKVTDQNIALQLLVAFAQLGHRRGAYNIEETAKLHECIEMFKVQTPKEEE